MIRKKILMLGDFAVGKTSLVRHYIDNTFDDVYLTTIGVKVSKKMLAVNHVELELLIWDIEGETPTKKIPKAYFKGASGAIIVCDASRKETIEGIREHIGDLLAFNREAKYVIAYNKSDLLSAQQKETLSLSENTFLTSAKDGSQIDILFTTLAKEILL
ncbi:Rab family GTPase [Sulfurovum sp.]|uniref:Rab family GTPase n=1 Tax=Sulfurovum sp. TaxID=1969726 RepID=UPI0025D24A96|nr:Rab family GTPase [Sulfurovum sp.]